MRETAFLILIALGVAALISGLIWTRLHWRVDVQPYRKTLWLEVVLHPERFAEGPAQGVVGRVNRVALLLLLAAVGIVLLEIVQSTSRQ
jgi:hypothetical protein